MAGGGGGGPSVTRYTKVFTTTCPARLIEDINADGGITPTCLQVITRASDSIFEFDAALSGAEETALDSKLSGWSCPPAGTGVAPDDHEIDDTAAPDPLVLWTSNKIDSEYYTRVSLDGGQLDNRYYTETEADAQFAPISHNHAASEIVSGTFADARIAQSNVIQHEAALNHDALSNWVANKHIDHTSVTLTADSGLSGGGDITANRSFSVNVQNSIEITSDALQLVGDSASPGNDKVYGTNGSGVKGWYDQTGGVSDIWVNETGDTMTGDLIMSSARIQLSDGSISAPALTFAGDLTTGWWREPSGDIALNVGGQEIFEVQTDGRVIISNNTPNYELLVTADNVIPNKKYVDDKTWLKNDITDFVEGDYVHVTGNESITGKKLFGQIIVSGYGTSSPPDYATGYGLSVQSAGSYSYLEILNNGGAGKGAFFGVNGNEFELWSYQAGDIVFYTETSASAGTDHFRMKTDGTFQIKDIGAGFVKAAANGDLSSSVILKSDLSDFIESEYVHTTGVESISGNKTFNNNVIVSGDLTVNGTTTTINTNELTVDDNIITLNNDVTGTPMEDGGIEVERGTSPNASLIWKESTDKWVAGISGSETEISLLGHTHTESDITDLGNYEPAFSKNTAFNKNFGTTIGTVAEGNHTHPAGDIDSGTFADARISQSSVTQHEGSINHNALTNWVANEHIDWTIDQGATNIDGRNIPAVNSISATATEVQLVGDAASPGNDKYYGTNNVGTRGFHDLPTGGGSGDVTSGANITDNRIVRGDGGAKGIQESAWAIADSGRLTGSGSVTEAPTGSPAIEHGDDHFFMVIHNTATADGGGLLIRAGEAQNDIALRIVDENESYTMLELHADNGELILGKKFADTQNANGVVYGVDNQNSGGAPDNDFNTQNGQYRMGGTPIPLQTFTFFGDQLMAPASDWSVNDLAPACADSNNASLIVRRFDDTTEEGVGFMVNVPSMAQEMTVRYKTRAETAGGSTKTAIVRLHRREIPDNSAISGSWTTTTLNSISLPNNEYFQLDSHNNTLSGWSLTAGNTYQMELTRQGTHGSDDLSGDLTLLFIEVEFA